MWKTNLLSPESPFVLHLTRLEGEQREESVCHSKRGGGKVREGDDCGKGKKESGRGERCRRRKKKNAPFQLPYSSNEMLTVEGSNRSKCMKPELVNCSLCGSCAIQHPSPVWTQSKAFLFGIISSPPNLTEAAQTASAPHFNMKVQNVFYIICSFSNACIFYSPTPQRGG